MTTKPQTIPAAEAFPLHTLVTPTVQGIASRVLARTAGGKVRAPPARMLLLMLRDPAEVDRQMDL